MTDCKKCNKKFKIPRHAIDPAYAIYCKKCIDRAARKFYSQPIDKIIGQQFKKLDK